MKKKEKIKIILKIFKEIYGEPGKMLNYTSPFELAIAVILSAQCTDERVNKVTGEMYKKYNKPEDFIKLSQEEVEELIRSTGFYKNKAKSIKKCSQQLIDLYDGEMPKTLKELVVLGGVGRKSANVILGHIFNIEEGIVVDTHVKRISKRIGFTKNIDPVKVEMDLLKIVPKGYWFIYSNYLIVHGRKRCKARKADCVNCEILKYCNYGEKELKK